MTALWGRLRAAWYSLRRGPDPYATRVLKQRDEAYSALDRLVRAVLTESDPAIAKRVAVAALEAGTAGGNGGTWAAVRAFQDETGATSVS